MTGFENISKEELCREWLTIMENTTTVKDLTSSIRFLRVCQELDVRKIDAHQIAKILVFTNSDACPHNYENHLKVE